VAAQKFEVLDGQQRITSIGRFLTDKFAIMENGNPKYFSSLPKDQQKKINESKMLIYECEGTETPDQAVVRDDQHRGRAAE
jgi:hypothetical protein